ncbi:hypothetical protein SD457_15265 [Coprobacillaceae bacterium CR2/5/TPMF4]|nr:hypothetical protein SD457_15265 [Coprobacillaceae bacterium CR2/5/TPMF4]
MKPYFQILSKGNEGLALPQELYDLREQTVFNELRITLKNENNYNYFSDEYLEYVDDVNSKIEKILNKQIDSLNEDLVNDAKEQLAKGEV